MIGKQGAISLTEADFMEKVARSDLPVLVDWWAQWCGPCRILHPIIDQLAEEFDGRAKVAKVNCDADVDFARGHSIHSLPTVTLWKGGAEVARLIGLRSVVDYRKLIENHI